MTRNEIIERIKTHAQKGKEWQYLWADFSAFAETFSDPSPEPMPIEPQTDVMDDEAIATKLETAWLGHGCSPTGTIVAAKPLIAADLRSFVPITHWNIGAIAGTNWKKVVEKINAHFSVKSVDVNATAKQLADICSRNRIGIWPWVDPNEEKVLWRSVVTEFLGLFADPSTLWDQDELPKKIMKAVCDVKIWSPQINGASVRNGWRRAATAADGKARVME